MHEACSSIKRGCAFFLDGGVEENDDVGSGNTGRRTQEATDGKAVEPEQRGCMRQMILIEMCKL